MVGAKGNAIAAEAVPQEIDLLLKQECLAGLELDTCSLNLVVEQDVVQVGRHLSA